MKRFLLPFICLLILGSCKKDEYETRYPQAYLPTYPGSYWIYHDGDTIRTGNNYVLTEIYKTSQYLGSPDYQSCTPFETAIFPVYNGSYVKDYTLFGINSIGSCYQRPVLSEIPGETLTLSMSKYHHYYLYMKAKDSIVTLPSGITYENVIVMNELNQGGPPRDIEYFYAKDIGFIGQKTHYNVSTLDTVPVWGKYLIYYYIND